MTDWALEVGDVDDAAVDHDAGAAADVRELHGPSSCSGTWSRPSVAMRFRTTGGDPMAHHPFDAPITLEGPERLPRQMLAEQTYGGHASLHDEGTAGSLGLPGAPIEGSTEIGRSERCEEFLQVQWFGQVQER
jgi:hypothetical protein